MSWDKKDYIDILKVIYKARCSDEKMNNLVKQNKGTSFFLSVLGHEIIGAFFSKVCSKKDWGFPYYRDRAFAIGVGCPLKDIFAAFLARDIVDHSGGRMMLDHFSDVKRNIPCQSSCVGSQFLQAVGVAKGISFDKVDDVVYVSSGDGATSQGDFHEALNFASIHNLSIIFVIQDNNFAISTPNWEQSAGKDPINFAKGYVGLEGFSANGWDIDNLGKVVLQAYKRAKNKEGPSLVSIKVPRLAPHTISDDPSKYKSTKLIEEEKKQDPVLHFEKWMIEKKYLDLQELEKIKEDIKKDVEIAASEAEKIPFPDKKTAQDYIFKKNDPIEYSKSLSEDKIVMMDALNHCLFEEMEKDHKMVVFGQDVADGKGGVFGITRGLTKKFGSRCFNTPLAESTIIGVAIGLAFYGYRPVCEIQFSDYCWTGINQIVNELSSIHYRSKGQWNMPVTIRMPSGGYIQGGPYHSQSVETVFLHTPGLKVVTPSNALDAKRLLKSAIADPNPVIFLEHKSLYRQRKCASFESSRDDLLEFKKAKILKEGKDITLVSWSRMANLSYEVAKDMDIDVEVIDLRSLNPLDLDSILKSIKKTSKLLIVHEACKTMGFGAEISASVSEKGFEYLDAPIKRVASKDAPVPYCKDLEDEILVKKEDVKKAIEELYNF